MPYLLGAPLFSLGAVAIGMFAVLSHFLSFGHNSLMDTAMGYDNDDPNKKHHPLVADHSKLREAHNVIQWGLALMVCVFALISIFYGINPLYSLLGIVIYVAFGHAYNDGLSKESQGGFLAISLCFVGLILWSFFLSNAEMTGIFALYVVYTVLTLLFQISYSGFLKEITVGEQSNVLCKMGAHVDEHGYYHASYAQIYAYIIKAMTLAIAVIMVLRVVDPLEQLLCGVWLFIMGGLLIKAVSKLCVSREYKRDKELMNMSIVEIITIFIPIPIMIGFVEAGILMFVCVVYFFAMNKLIWKANVPKV